MGTLGQRALAKVSGPAWEGGLRAKFMQLSETLLGVAPDTFAELTTIYVKFSLSASATSPVYAVVWIKNSRRWLVGLSLPEEIEHPLLGHAPPQKSYTGLTKYFSLSDDDALPSELQTWATMAFEKARS